MYRRILVAVENSGADRTILAHVEQLAQLTGAKLLLVHVADGWAARHFNQLNLRESEEMQADRAYLDARCARISRAAASTWRPSSPWAIPPTSSSGSPTIDEVDLIAMSTHGHRFLADLLHGTTADRSGTW